MTAQLVQTQFAPQPAARLVDLASLHPDVWRGAQLARSHARCVETGFAELNDALPGGGWPMGSMTELMVQQPGVGEIRLLRAAFRALGSRRVVLLGSPHAPQGLSWLEWGLDPARLVWVRAQKTADALWSAEHLLRSATCGAVLFWQQKIRPESLRRLHLAAQAGEALFFMIRPLNAALDSSPAPLRLTVEPSEEGARVNVIKRRGPALPEPIALALDPKKSRSRTGKNVTPERQTEIAAHANLDRAELAPPSFGRVPADVVG